MDPKTVNDLISLFQQVAGQYAQMEAMPVMVEGEQISTREVHAIDAIGSRRLNTVTDVSKFFGITKSAASQLISKLEKRGFLSKNSSPNNNKELQLDLTELGWEAYRVHEALHGKERTVLRQELELFSEQQLQDCHRLMVLFSLVLEKRLKRG